MELISIAHVMSARTASITDLSSKILLSDKPVVAMASLVNNALCSQMVNIKFTAETSNPSCPSNDGVMEYAIETLLLGLMLLEFKDAIREGDRNRVLRYWKYFLLFFRATQHKNYCIEAFNFLMHYTSCLIVTLSRSVGPIHQ